jgi:[ribosomal protein S5]-alanine N-acetyltransferase
MKINTKTAEVFQLRSWQLGDEESLAENANNPKITANVRDSFPHPYTIEDAKFWINLAHQQEGNFAIIVNEKAVGGIGILLKEDIYRKNAEIGYWLGEPYWGQGIITEAIKKMVDFTFANYDIHRIYAGVFEYNLASMRVLEKAGFQFETVLKKSLFKNGQLWDDHVYVKFRN